MKKKSSVTSLAVIGLCAVLFGTLAVTRPAYAVSLSATTTVATFPAINWNDWGRDANADTIFYGWTATTSVMVCGVQVPISRESASSPLDHRLPMSVGIVVSTSTTPETTTFIANTSFAEGYYSEDYPISSQPAVDSMTILFDVYDSGDVACQTIAEGTTVWVKITELDDPVPSGDAWRYGSDLSGSNIGARVCYRNHATQVVTCSDDGYGSMRILSDADATALNISFSDPVLDYDTSQITPEMGGLAKVMSDLAKYLFVPSNSSKNYLAGARDDMSDRVPFGYFALASSTMLGMAGDTSTTSSVLTLYSTPTGTQQLVPLFSMTDIENKIPINIRTNLQVLGGVAVWAMFFVWIVSLATHHPFKSMGIVAPEGDDNIEELAPTAIGMDHDAGLAVADVYSMGDDGAMEYEGEETIAV
jgi:hypothetical protein